MAKKNNDEYETISRKTTVTKLRKKSKKKGFSSYVAGEFKKDKTNSFFKAMFD